MCFVISNVSKIQTGLERATCMTTGSQFYVNTNTLPIVVENRQYHCLGNLVNGVLHAIHTGLHDTPLPERISPPPHSLLTLLAQLNSQPEGVRFADMQLTIEDALILKKFGKMEKAADDAATWYGTTQLKKLCTTVVCNEYWNTLDARLPATPRTRVLIVSASDEWAETIKGVPIRRHCHTDTTQDALNWVENQTEPCILVGSRACASILVDTPMHLASVYIPWQPTFARMDQLPSARNVVCEYADRAMVDNIPNVVRVVHTPIYERNRICKIQPTIAISLDGRQITSPLKCDASKFERRHYLRFEELWALRFTPLNRPIAYFMDAKLGVDEIEMMREVCGNAVLVCVRI